jgi:hypothetical protein
VVGVAAGVSVGVGDGRGSSVARGTSPSALAGSQRELTDAEQEVRPFAAAGRFSFPRQAVKMKSILEAESKSGELFFFMICEN